MTGTERERAVAALATALHGIGWFDTGYTYETDQKNAADIIANLPPGWHLVHEEDVARRLHDYVIDSAAGCSDPECQGWKVDVPLARRLLGQDGNEEVTAEGEGR